MKNISVKFPTLFTIDELQQLNPDVVNITLRYKINQAISRGVITQVGKTQKELGRPKIIFCKCPVDQNTKEEVKKRGAVLLEK
jgi:hypothetical protein